MNFGKAIEAIKNGKKVARTGWNGTFISYMPELNHQEHGPKVNDRTSKAYRKDTPLESQSYIAMFTAQKKWQPGWVPSQADMLREDWEVLS